MEMGNSMSIEAEAEYQMRREVREEMVNDLKSIKRKAYEAKKLLNQYGREADKISNRIARDLKILGDN